MSRFVFIAASDLRCARLRGHGVFRGDRGPAAAAGSARASEQLRFSTLKAACRWRVGKRCRREPSGARLLPRRAAAARLGASVRSGGENETFLRGREQLA